MDNSYEMQIADENTKNLESLINRISSNQCCAFIGAGLSRNLGYPTWKALIEDLGKVSQSYDNYEECDFNLSLWKKGDWYRNILGEDNYLKELARILESKNRDEFRPVHQVIVQIPFNSFITTNYDFCLENSAGPLRRAIQPRSYPDLDASFLRSGDVFHIHGFFDSGRPQSVGTIILTERDYQKAYNEHRELSTFLHELFRYHSIVFMGFSFEDDFFVKALENIRVGLRQFAEFESTNGIKINQDTNCFMLGHENDINPKRDQLKILGIEPITYNGDEITHPGLQRILERILYRITGFEMLRPRPNTDCIEVRI